MNSRRVIWLCDARRTKKTKVIKARNLLKEQLNAHAIICPIKMIMSYEQIERAEKDKKKGFYACDTSTFGGGGSFGACLECFRKVGPYL